MTFIPRTDSFQIEFNIDNYGGGGSKYVFDKRSVGDTTIGLLVLFEAVNADLQIHAGGVTTDFSELPISDGNFHTVKIVIPASSSGMVVYYDNVAQTPTSGTGLIGTANNTASDITIGARYTIEQFIPASISNLKFTKNGSLVAQFPMSEGNFDDISDTENDLQVTMAGTTSNIWDNTQDAFHYNITKGFDKWTKDSDDSILEVPYQSDGTPTLTDGGAITGFTWVSTHPYLPQGHNGTITKFTMPAGNTKLIAADYDNLWYDGSEVPIPNTFQNIPTRIGQNDLLGRFGGFLSDTNGDGLADGWTVVTSDTLTLLNNIQTFTATAEDGHIYSDIADHATYRGHKIYLFCIVDAGAANINGYVSDGVVDAIVNISNTGDFAFASLITTIAGGSTGFRIKIQDDNAAGWAAINIKYVGVLDLTANELDSAAKSFMDANYLEYLGIDIIAAKDQTDKTGDSLTIFDRALDNQESAAAIIEYGVTE